MAAERIKTAPAEFSVNDLFCESVVFPRDPRVVIAKQISDKRFNS